MTLDPSTGGPSGDGGTQRRLELLSVVAPVFNEDETIREFHARAVAALGHLPFELILVDDGSADGSAAIIRELAGADPRVKVITLSRNFGHQAALTAGLDHASGDAVAMIDADLQDPPELILTMLERWQEGIHVVYAVRTNRPGESRWKLASSRWFYRVFGRMAQIDLQPNAGDFRMIDRQALTALGSMRERNRFIRGMSVWIGFTQTAVAYERDPRHAGHSKYTNRKMIRFSLDAISSFSHAPLQAATALGFLVSSLAFLAIPVAIGLKIAGEFVPGVTTVLIAVLLLGGIQLITVGLIGEYVGRVYDEVKGRPLYVVDGRTNIAAAASERPGEYGD